MENEWELKVREAAERKERLRSFGPHATAIVAETQQGVYALDPEDNSVTHWLLTAGEFAPAELAIARSFLSQTSRALVVGAHVGALAIPLSKACSELDAFEANPATQKLLSFNKQLNSRANLNIYPYAASDSDAPIKFLKNRENSGGSKRMPANPQWYYTYDEPELVTVEARRLDDLLGPRQYDLIIMDIEGSEYFALRGMQNILSLAKALAVEFLPHHIRDVAAVDAGAFAKLIEPHFNFMYSPTTNALTRKEHIFQTMIAMYERGEQCDNLYFFKEASADWLSGRGLL